MGRSPSGFMMVLSTHGRSSKFNCFRGLYNNRYLAINTANFLYAPREMYANQINIYSEQIKLIIGIYTPIVSYGKANLLF